MGLITRNIIGMRQSTNQRSSGTKSVIERLHARQMLSQQACTLPSTNHESLWGCKNPLILSQSHAHLSKRAGCLWSWGSLQYANKFQEVFMLLHWISRMLHILTAKTPVKKWQSNHPLDGAPLIILCQTWGACWQLSAIRIMCAQSQKENTSTDMSLFWL